MLTQLLILGSVATSTVLIMINKKVMNEYGFHYPTVLTTFHFALGCFLNWSMVKLKLFVPGSAPQIRIWIQSFLGVACLVLMNYNLKMNSVGFYQLSKLCNIPMIVAYKFFALKQTTPPKELFTLCILLVGLIIFSVNDVTFNLPGCIVAIFAVVVTAAQQTGIQTVQKEFKISGTQLNYLVHPPQFILGVLTSLVLEAFGDNGVFNHNFGTTELCLILSTGLIACMSNIIGFSLIGKCGPVTYQVVGHCKTLMIFIFGTLLFPAGARESRDMLIKKIIGLCVAMVGVVLYTVVQMTAPKPAPPVKETHEEEEVEATFAHDQFELQDDEEEEHNN